MVKQLGSEKKGSNKIQMKCSQRSNSNSNFNYERHLWNNGFQNIVGIDEVGRGPLAGPLVVSAAKIPTMENFPCVNDSKKLTSTKRERLYQQIISFPGIEYFFIEISSPKIDQLNILKATQMAMRNIVKKFKNIDYVLIDGNFVPDFPIKSSEFLVKGDSKSSSIATASILAKVYRDSLMEEYSKVYPKYGFEKNKGYGTKEHLKALETYGPCTIHRKTFSPIKNIVSNQQQLELFDN